MGSSRGNLKNEPAHVYPYTGKSLTGLNGLSSPAVLAHRRCSLHFFNRLDRFGELRPHGPATNVIHARLNDNVCKLQVDQLQNLLHFARYIPRPAGFSSPTALASSVPTRPPEPPSRTAESNRRDRSTCCCRRSSTWLSGELVALRPRPSPARDVSESSSAAESH